MFARRNIRQSDSQPRELRETAGCQENHPVLLPRLCRLQVCDDPTEISEQSQVPPSYSFIISTSSSTSTSSVASASPPSPQSASQTENEAETELFWNRYKRQDTKKRSIGKLIKRALSINVKNRPVRNCKSKTSLDILEQNSPDETPGEGFYDEVYSETCQQVSYHQQLHNKSKLKNRSMSAIVL